MPSEISIPHVCVVVPNRNGISHLSYSLPSLFATDYANFRVVLIDDRSSDGSLRFVEDKFPTVQILRNDSKRGFAATVNVGARYAIEHRAEFVAISNSDIKIPTWLIGSAVNLFSVARNVGVVGFREITGDSVSYSFPAAPEKVEWAVTKNVAGCFFMVETSVFSRIGLFDEDYFMYGEDNDFFHRVRRADYQLVQTNIPVWHYGEGASEKQALRTTWLAYRNAIRFALKNETFGGVVRMLLSLLNQGCNVFRPERSGHRGCHRMRRYGALGNLLIILASCCWNVIHIVPTVRARRLVRMRLSQSDGSKCES